MPIPAATEQPVDTSTAAGKAFFDMFGVFAEIETNLRRERQAEGIVAARRTGIYRDRPSKIDMDAIGDRIAGGRSPTRIAPCSHYSGHNISLLIGNCFPHRKLSASRLAGSVQAFAPLWR